MLSLAIDTLKKPPRMPAEMALQKQAKIIKFQQIDNTEQITTHWIYTITVSDV